MVYQSKKPWTRKGTAEAFRKATRAAIEEYIVRYDTFRTWDPINGPEVAEMSQGIELLSPETVVGLDVVTVTEAQVPNYVAAGLRGAGDDRIFQLLYGQWGKSEWKHHYGFHTIQIASGLKTEKETDGMIADSLSQPWSDRVQFHLKEEEIGSIAYGVFYARPQEGDTADNYEILIDRIWRELGAETGRQNQPIYRGIAKMIRNIKIDETYHKNLFTALGQIWLQYYPDEAIDAINQVYHDFTMPIVKTRDPELVYKAAMAIGFESTRRKVLRESFNNFGLSGFMALSNAMDKVRGLPNNAVVQRPTGPLLEILGAPTYEIQPDGEFTLVRAA